MYEFKEVEWADKALRGKDFGFHGKTYAYLKGRQIVMHVRTGATTEEHCGFILGPSWGGPRFDAVFAEENGEPLEFNSMYLTSDGVDPLSLEKTGHPYIPREPRVNAALKPHTDYYLTINILSEGPAGWEPSFKVQVFGTDYDGQSTIGSNLDVVIGGVRYVPESG